MSPAAKSSRLLYVPDFLANSVEVYGYPSGVLVGKLSGFSGPSGACVDKAQNVWITEQTSAQLVEYAHAGTRPIATLSDPGLDPVDCAIDPSSGDLAVANQSGTNNQGTIVIYKAASGTPQVYKDGRQIYWFYHCAYDASGDLFVDGMQFPYNFPVGQFQYAELTQGSSDFTNLTLQPNKNIKWPGGLHWDGSYIALLNPTKGTIYRLSGGTVASTVTLKGARGAIEFTLDRAQLLAGLDQDSTNVNIWNYPMGEGKTKTLTLPKRRNPVVEVVVSE